MTTKEVTVSGSVGKQVFATTGDGNRVNLRGFLLASLSAKARVVIRDGNASGTVRFQGNAISGASLPVELPGLGVPFHKGMHVKVLGTGATCYLYID